MTPTASSSMETLLCLRREQAHAVRAELAQAQAEVRLREGRIDRVARTLAEHGTAAQDAAEGNAPSWTWPVYRRCVGDLYAVLAEHRNRLAEARAVLRECQEKVTGSAGEMEAVQRLQAARGKRRDRDAELAEAQESQDLHAAVWVGRRP